jgi:DNA-binding NtrC family response regulator
VLYQFEQRENLRFAKIPPFNGQQPAPLRPVEFGGPIMQSAAVAEPVQSTNHVVEYEDVAARCAATTLITASTATDVERLARRIHAASARSALSFVQASAAALPVEPRAFLETCAGLIEAAAGGTLLLTGVEEMPAFAQERFIETLAHQQDARNPSVTVRLIAGTTVCLRQRIADGAFSERLFYRLNVIHVAVKDAHAERVSAQEASV